jgi:hypothetical protein
MFRRVMLHSSSEPVVLWYDINVSEVLAAPILRVLLVVQFQNSL